MKIVQVFTVFSVGLLLQAVMGSAEESEGSYHQKADEKYEKRDFAGAIVDYDKALRLNPKAANLYHSRGCAKLSMFDYEGAIADYNEAIRLNPKVAAFYGNRASAKSSRRDYEGAITDYSEEIRLEPKNAHGYLWRGITKRERHDFDGAIADLTEAMRLNPDDQHVALEQRVLTRYEQSDYDGTIADCTELLRLSPGNGFAYDLRGQAKRRKGDWVESEIDRNEGRNPDPEKPAIPQQSASFTNEVINNRITSNRRIIVPGEKRALYSSNAAPFSTNTFISPASLSKQTQADLDALLLKSIQSRSSESGDKDIREALRIEANVNAVTEGTTPLMRACAWGNLSAAQILIDAGADVNLQDKYGTTALHSAAAQSHLAVVDLLLDHKANPSLRSYEGWTPLVCVRQGDIAEHLINHGADPNSVDRDGRSVLLWVVCVAERDSRLRQVVEVLLKHGANPNYKLPEGPKHQGVPYERLKTPIAAAACCDVEMVKLLMEHGATLTDATMDEAATQAASRGKTEVLQFLVSQGLIVKKCWRAMAEAIASKKQNSVEWLVTNGYDPSLKNEYGHSAMDYAQIYKRSEISSYLEDALSKAKLTQP